MTTMLYEPVNETLALPPTADPVATRAAALNALDADVQALLRHHLTDDGRNRLGRPGAMIALTTYDTVYPANPAGGHWTAAVRRPALLAHQVQCYTVTLEFDERHRPARFQVSGAGEVVSDDASLAALDWALVRAKAAGPLVTWAPSFMPGISL